MKSLSDDLHMFPRIIDAALIVLAADTSLSVAPRAPVSSKQMFLFLLFPLSPFNGSDSRPNGGFILVVGNILPIDLSVFQLLQIALLQSSRRVRFAVRTLAIARGREPL
jgi:hypothetical protein